jgi:hypothetical protein
MASGWKGVGRIDPRDSLPSTDPRIAAATLSQVQNPLDVLQLLLQLPAVVYRRG